jgi:hypothetical protein
MAYPTAANDPLYSLAPSESKLQLSPGVAIAVSGANTTDLFTATAHGLIDGDAVVLTITTGLTGLTTATTYYVVTSLANTFQLAATPGGAAINFTADGTGTVGLIVDLPGIAADYSYEFEEGKRDVSGSDGVIRTDRRILKKEEQSFDFEVSDVKRLKRCFGNINDISGRLTKGTAKLWIKDPNDTVSNVSVLAVKAGGTSAFGATWSAKQLSLKNGEFTSFKLTINATDKVELKVDVAA